MSDAAPAGVTLEEPEGVTIEAAPQGVTIEPQATEPALVPVAYDAQAEDDEQAKDAEVRALFEAGITKQPDKWAGIVGVANKTGAPIDLVEKRYDDFKRSAEVDGFDARAWRRDNPVLYQILTTEHPELAPVVMRDKAIKEFQDVVHRSLPENEPLWRRALAAAAGAMTSPGAFGTTPLGVVDTKPTEPGQVAMQDRSDMSALQAATDWYGRNRAQSQLSSLGTRQMALDAMAESGDVSHKRAAYEGNKRIVELQQSLGDEPYYGQGALGRLGLDVVQGVASQVDSLLAEGGGAAAGAAIAGVPALIATRSPAEAVQAAKLGAKVGAGALGFLSSFNQEAGQAYLEFRDAKTDAGTPVTTNAAVGAAVAYGIAAAGVEVLTIGDQLRAFGLGSIADAAAKGEGAAAAKKLLADRTKTAILSDFGKAWVKSAGEEGTEEAVQSFLQSIANWDARSFSAGGGAQSFDMTAALEDAAHSGYLGAVGSALGLGGAQLAMTAVVEGARIRSSENAAKRVAAIAGVANSTTAQAAPAAMAAVIEDETNRSGQAVTHLYVDPVRLTEAVSAAGGDPEQAARDLMGEDGPARVQRALAERVDSPGNRATLEVPVAEFLEKWGKKPFVEQLIQHMAVRPGQYMPSELAEAHTSLGEQATAIEKERAATQEQLPASIEESRRLFAAKSPEQQSDAFHRDSVTGTLNERAFSRLPPDPERPMVAVIDGEGGKWANNDSHNQGDRLIQAYARALQSVAPEVGRGSSGFLVRVKDQAEADAILEKARSALPESMRDFQIRAVAVEPSAVSGAARTLTQQKKEAEAAGARAKRGDRPLGSPVARATELGLPEQPVVTPVPESLAASHAAMSEDERFNAIHIEPDTGLYTAAAFTALPENGAAVSFDLDGLQVRNDVDGDEVGDAMLRAFSRILVKHGGLALNATHLHGDEYAAGKMGASKGQLAEWVDKVRNEAESVRIYVDLGDDIAVWHGVGFEAGIEDSYAAADEDLSRRKEAVQQQLKAAGSSKRDSELKRRIVYRKDSEEGKAALDAARGGGAPDRSGRQSATGRGTEGASGARGGGVERAAGSSREEVIASSGARAMGAVGPLWRTHVEAGMTPAQWESYLREQAETTTKTAVRLRRARAESDLRAAEARKTDEFKKLKGEAEKAWSERPDVRAWRYVRTGEQTLSDGRVVQEKALGKLDKNALERLVGKGHPLIKSLTGRLAENGEDPVEVARRFGFSSARDLAVALADLPEKAPTVQADAERMMHERHPEIEGEIARLGEYVQRVLHEEGTSDWLLKEWAQLKRRAGVSVPLDAVRQAAKSLVQASAVGRLYLGTALNRERAAAEHAALATAQGNFAQAYVYKQKQLLEHYVWRELDEAIKNRDRFQKLVARMNDDKSRARIGQAGEGLLAASDEILAALGVRPPATDEVDAIGFVNAIRTLDESDGGAAFDVDRLARLVQKPPDGGWKNLTVDDARLVEQALSQIYVTARDRNTLIRDGKRIALAGVNAKIDEESAYRPDKGRPSDQQGRWAGIKAGLLEPREVIARLGETAFDVLWRGSREAEQAEDALARRVGAFFAKIWNDLPKVMQEQRFDAVDDLDGVEWPADVDREPRTDRQWMWMVALNMGNASNMERLLGGYHWDEAKVRGWLNRNMTKEEWSFVQGVWDLLDKELYPEVERVYTEAKGIAPDKIEAQSFDTPHGTMRGGYFPAKYDPVASRVGEKQSLEQLEKNYHQKAGAISVANGFTKGRAKKYSDVVNLEWSVVPGHVLTVVHYAAYDRFVRGARALMTSKEFARIARHRIGDQNYANLIDPDAGWLAMTSSAASDAVPRNLRDTYWALGLGKQALVTASIGLSIKTALGDFVDPLSAVMTGQVGAKHMASSMAGAYSPVGALPGVSGFMSMRRQAMEKSHVVRHRAENAVRSLQQQLASVGDRSGKFVHAYVRANEAGHWFLEQSDKLATTIVWDAAYSHAVANGLEDAAAVRSADDVVEATMPVQDRAKKAAILRDARGVGGQLLLMFGYMSKKYNQVASVLDPALAQMGNADGFGEKLQGAGRVAMRSGQAMAVLAVGQLLGELVQGHGREPDEDSAEWIIRKMLAAPFVILPFVGQFVEEGVNRAVSFAADGRARSRDLNIRAAPALEAVKRAWKLLENAASEDRDDDQRFWDMAELLGFALPVAPLARTAGRYATGGQDTSPLGVASGAVYGEREGQPLNPLTALEGALGN